ncbi:MAG: xanthine dehydrogenase accessory protein XdhC [Proteobacteria bacterium]|nr:xanthine dehydrogenase accessory protein XdhC [Pseudomonadota bacterium]
MPSWLDALAALDRADEACVLVSVIAARGSAPREAGVKMVVSATGSWDTIGGGNLEHQSILTARAMLAGGGRAPAQRDFPLGPALGQCCGGATTVLFEPIRPPAWTVALFGAGHVGRALAKLLGELPCRLIWFDARPDIFPGAFPTNTRLRHSTTAADIADLRPGASALIMTHDHATDFTLTESALARDDLAFIGTIGSETKRARFVSRLRRAGLSEDRLARLHCPIGLPGIGTKLPAEIAIAVAAQLLAHRPPARAASDQPTPAAPEGCGAGGCDACSPPPASPSTGSSRTN